MEKCASLAWLCKVRIRQGFSCRCQVQLPFLSLLEVLLVLAHAHAAHIRYCNSQSAWALAKCRQAALRHDPQDNSLVAC
jgi:hypothetical protein